MLLALSFVVMDTWLNKLWEVDLYYGFFEFLVGKGISVRLVRIGCWLGRGGCLVEWVNFYDWLTINIL